MRRRPLVISLTSAAGVAVLVVGAVVVYVQLLRHDAPPPLAIGDRASDLLDASSTPAAPTSASSPSSSTPSSSTPSSAVPSSSASIADPSVAPPADASTSPGPTSSSTGTTTAGLVDPDSATGTWTTTDDCIVGYRVAEDFVGGLQNAEAVGRTSAVTGTVEVDGTTIRAASFTADVSTLRSDDGRRDRQVRDRLLDTGTWPTATFTLAEPLELGSDLADGEQVVATATGTLTLRDQTRAVTVAVTAVRTGDEVQLLGGIDVVFADWGIPAPTNPLVSVRDHGTLEFSLWLTRAP